MAGGAGLVVHPWRRLRELAHITLLWHDHGPMGLADHQEQTVSLRRGMTWAQRRCTLTHELLHLERGPALSTTKHQDEERVRRETARRMIPDVRILGEALAWALDEHECADELGVDVPVLRYRLRHLHPAERGYLCRRLVD
jgi:hypothetical protein